MGERAGSRTDARGASSIGELVIAVGTGDWGEANTSAFVDPFRRETGVKVKLVHDWFDASAVRRLGESGASGVDVVPVGHTTVVEAERNGWLEAIDYSRHAQDDLANMAKEARRPFGLAPICYSIIIAYWRDQFPNGGPQSWADFWDVERFPGKRGLRAGDYPAGLLESALLADGVPADKLYPLDLDRAFARLDRVRPHIASWWRDGVDQQQIFIDRAVDLGSAFNGRIATLQDGGLPVVLEWNQGFLLLDYFVIPKGGPNPTNAQRFIAFLSRPDNQAAFATLMPYGPTNALAYQRLDPARAAMLPSHPRNLAKQIVIDTDWYMASCGDATNDKRLIRRWTEWSKWSK